MFIASFILNLENEHINVALYNNKFFMKVS